MRTLDDIRIESILSSTLLNSNPDKKFVFIEGTSGIEIMASPFEVLAAEYGLNRLFILQGYASVENFLRMLGYTGEISINGDLGWSFDLAAEEGWQWIDFTHDFIKKRGAFMIDYPFPPEFDYMEAWE